MSSFKSIAVRIKDGRKMHATSALFWEGLEGKTYCGRGTVKAVASTRDVKRVDCKICRKAVDKQEAENQKVRDASHFPLALAAILTAALRYSG